MKWQKLGLVYAPTGDLWWAKSYAHLPTAELIDDDIIRIYFASLDDKKYGRIGCVDLDIDQPTRIRTVYTQPVLDLGDLGAFDDCGVTPSCIIRQGQNKYLYYIGWQRCEKIPYMLYTGLAISDQNQFRKLQRTPILDRTHAEPFSRSAPCVLYEEGSWKMWYWSCIAWSAHEELPHYNNVIKFASSADGKNWQPLLEPCIKPNFINEYSIGRPWVIKEGNKYQMWYSIRSLDKPYCMGYAESPDGINWTRRDEFMTLDQSKSGWDSEMICYPCVVTTKNKKYLFYNGNQHGATGFGCAVLDA
jgi:predicted GH43/DUF377 family glycosyl hydrolase